MLRDKWWVAVLAAGLIAGCTEEDNSPPPGPAPIPATGSASGRVWVDLGNTTGGTATGTVTVVIGRDSVVLPVNVTFDVSRILQVEYSFPTVEAGRVVVVYVANLTVGAEHVVRAGFSITEVVAGQATRVDSTDFTVISGDPDYTVTSGAPQITGFQASAASVTIANVTVSGTVSNMDLDRLFIFVNGNAFAVIVNPSASGTAAFQTVLTLEPGANQIYAVAMNSTGTMAVSQTITVTYTPQTSGNAILATLIWDSPTSDMDFHLWTYTSPNPSLPSTANEHCAYWRKDISIAPDGAAPNGNLDVDDTDGEGPEHMTLINYPDGYYVFAVNSYSLHGDDHAYITVTVSVPGGQQRTMRHNFTTANSEDYATGMDAWVRCFDVRVSGGVATILDPNPSFQYHEDALHKAALPKMVKAK